MPTYGLASLLLAGRATALLLLARRATAEYSCPLLEPAAVSPKDDRYAAKPVVDCSFKFVGGSTSAWSGKTDVATSPIYNATTGARAVLGAIPSMGEEEAMEAVQAAAAAWDKGQGEWPRMSLANRIEAIERLVLELRKAREQMVAVLEWGAPHTGALEPLASGAWPGRLLTHGRAARRAAEIAKTSKDAAAEFDRTMSFVAAVIAELKRDPNLGGGFASWTEVSGVGVRMRRGPVGVMLALAPFNYPLNEMCAPPHPPWLAVLLPLPASSIASASTCTTSPPPHRLCHIASTLTSSSPSSTTATTSTSTPPPPPFFLPLLS